MEQPPMDNSEQRITIATLREDFTQTVVLRDELPALEQDEIRLRVDKVGLSANNLFYAQMGEAPFLKFFAVYPLDEQYGHLANMPAWGVATIIASKNPEFAVGERFRGFLHLTNVVQMKAKRSEDGFTAYGAKRDKLNQAYNGFRKIDDSVSSPLGGTGEKSDLAMTCSPGASSGFILYELLKSREFFYANAVVLTSASSKLSLATAYLLKGARKTGPINQVIGYTSEKNKAFVEGTGLYDAVLTYETPLPADTNIKGVFIDVAGDANIYKRSKAQLVKGIAVGGTHADAKASTFTAFGASGFLKMFIDMVAPQAIKAWASRSLNPPLEMFFAPTVINELLAKWGQVELDRKTNAALSEFVDAAVDKGWINVNRCEDIESIQEAYQRIVSGKVPPSEAVVLEVPYLAN